MAWSTAFTELFSVQYPIALAPMGGSAGGALAAAVSNGGGLGLLGGGPGDRTVERALAAAPAAVMLSFGDPRPFTAAIRAAGALLILQVTDLEEARQAVDLGADVIVAQGTESGGRGVAAALALGAAGALLGTRFQATAEALVDPAISQAIIEGRGEDTERSVGLDIARGSRWPAKYPGRTLGHPFLDEWRGRETELAEDAGARQAYRDGVASGALPPQPVWAGEAVDLIHDLPAAAGLVAVLAAEAEHALARAGRR
jgi:nitronate monooxygenase